jgi:hypothetical protein
MALAEDDFVYLPFEQAVEPSAHAVAVFRDNWWSVHPERGLLLYKSRKSVNPWKQWIVAPQCNPNRLIAEKLTPPWASVQLMPIAFVPIEVRDYDYFLRADKAVTVDGPATQ